MEDIHIEWFQILNTQVDHFRFAQNRKCLQEEWRTPVAVLSKHIVFEYSKYFKM